MKNNNIENIKQTIILATVAGSRAMMAPALLCLSLYRRPSKLLADTKCAFLQSGICTGVMALAAIGELVGDKLPETPNRTNIGGVIGRGISGAIAGGTIYKINKGNTLTGAVLGAAVAVGATYASFYLRKKLGKHFKLNDPIVGGVEDILAISAGFCAL